LSDVWGRTAPTRSAPRLTAPRGLPLAYGSLFALAVALRLMLCWANPPENAFDDHFEPIRMIMKTGAIPAKDACFECYHPPVFYWTSAMIGKAARALGLSDAGTMKLLQLLVCIAGILTVAVCYPIVQRFPLPDRAKLLAFGTVCLLPRHIYMSAMHGNDTLAYLLAALAVYLALVMFERNAPPAIVVAVGAVVTVAIFTKYTSVALLPAMAVALLRAWRGAAIAPHRRLLIAALGTVVLPSLLLAGSMAGNLQRYGTVFPWNVSIYDPSLHRPRDPGGIDFFSFKPWEKVDDLVLVPGELHSFWTLVYSGMWFDTEPYFVSYLDANEPWWERYYAWYRGEGPYPGRNPSISRLTRITGAGFILLGLVPAALVLLGLGLALSGAWRRLLPDTPAMSVALSLLVSLLAFNVAGLIALTLRLPVYNAMKPSYLLTATPSFMISLALGAAWCGRSETWRRILGVAFGILFALAIVHIVHVSVAILGAS